MRFHIPKTQSPGACRQGRARQTAQMAAVFTAIREKWGRLDFLVHSLAFAPKADLQGRLNGPRLSSRRGTPGSLFARVVASPISTAFERSQ